MSNEQHQQQVDIVVARFHEDVTWLIDLIANLKDSHSTVRLFIYDKGFDTPQEFRKQLYDLISNYQISVHFQRLSNVGREAHTYMYHIINHYHEYKHLIEYGVRPYIVFTQGRISDHLPWIGQKNYDSTTDLIMQMLHDAKMHPLRCSANHCSPWNDVNLYDFRLPAFGGPLRSADMSFGEWFDKYVKYDGPFPKTETHKVWMSAIFSVDAKLLIDRPFDYFCQLMTSIPIDSSNPEVAHYFERGWYYVFNVADEKQEASQAFPLFKNRTIWLLWFQGWDKAPALVKTVRDTWAHHNLKNGWKIVELHNGNLHEYIDCIDFNNRTMTPQAASDIIRLRLMARHGGVWADATMACMRPLDDWIDEAIQPAGFWMYHGRDKGRGPASWFMAANPGSYIATKWIAASDAYWTNGHDNEYFWMDRLFAQLLSTDQQFMDSWRSVPFLDCEAPYQSHCFSTNVFNTADDQWMAEFAKSPVLAVKLCHHGSEHRNHANTNAARALQISLSPTRPSPQPVTWGIAPSFDGATFF